MKISLTVKELLQIAQKCLSSGGCMKCALGAFCEGYEDLERLCQIVQTEPDVQKAEPVRNLHGSNKDEPSEKSGGVTKTTDELVDEILAASDGQKSKPENGSKAAARDRKRILRRLSEGVGEYGDQFIEEVYAAGNGEIDREELYGMISGVRYQIDRWRAAEKACQDAGY